MKKRYVLKNKARFYIFVTVMAISILTVFSFTKAYGYKEREFEMITIKSGDTLWDIAKKYNKQGDIREYIYELKKINNLSDSGIMAGDELKVVIE